MAHYRPYNKESRAQRRLHGEDVFGRKIAASNADEWRSINSPRNIGRKITKSNDYSAFNIPPPNYQDNLFLNRDTTWFNEKSQKAPLLLQEPNTFRTSRSCPPHQEYNWRHNSFSNRPKTPQEERSQNIPFYQANTFKPISSSQLALPQPVELVISNLDGSIKDLRNVLMDLLKEHAMIYSLNVSSQQDGSPVALVKVSSQQEAKNVISKLHHYKLGFKRLTISHTQTNGVDPVQLKEMVVTLLQEAPMNCMALYRLMNLLEDRFLTNVSVSEVNKLRDVCRIADDNGERIISLTPEMRASRPCNLNRAHTLYCSVHCPNGLGEDFLWNGSDEPETLEIPHVRIDLKTFSSKLNVLLTSHMGNLPLLSFAICYKQEFEENFPTDPTGVPLEHLISCVPNVSLKYGTYKNTKYIVRDMTLKVNEPEKDDTFTKSLSPSITSKINLLSRELVDLLKMQERCELQLQKYIPAYHHHFGRQLRVADYGYTKLSDLLYSQPISNIVQILGEGSKRTITLTHATQVRRFTSDLLRVLKGQVSKQLMASDFPAAYEKVLGRPFNPVEYGLCSLEDLLDEVPDNTLLITKNHQGQISIAIPKREQTAEEIMRTKQFAEEVIKLLSYSPQCSMLFNKFVPAYHHHFGHQCKVSDYGFTKLIELFEAIPDTVKVEELGDGERKVSLTLQKAVTLRGNQIAELIRKSHLSYLPLEGLASCFQREYGYPLKPQYYNCTDIKELVSKLCDYIQVTQSSAGPLLVTVESGTHSTLALRIWAILVNPPHHLNVNTVINKYNTRYQGSITVSTLEQLNNVIINRSSSTESIIFLSPNFAVAAKIYLLLYKEGGQIPYYALNSLYRRSYGMSLLQSEDETYEKLLNEFSFLIVMRRTKKRTNIALNSKITEYGLYLPGSVNKNDAPYSRMEESVSWPPPPVHDLCLDGSNRGITPPKPDTPPAPGTAPWKLWDTPTKFMDFSIPLPAAHTPKLMGNTESLMSPTLNLLSATVHPMCSMMSVSPPNPNELPMPDKLLKKGVVSDDSTDSGVMNNSHVASENEM